MRAEVKRRIQELRKASRASLYNGNFSTAGFPVSIKSNSPGRSHPPSAKRARRDVHFRDWEMILADVTALLPFMTDQEHSQVSQLVSVLLLGFLLPHSTGSEFFLLQNLSSSNHQTAGLTTSENLEDSVEYSIQSMSLIERLEVASLKYNPNSFGEHDVIVNEEIGRVFHSFLIHAIRPFLNKRPAHTRQVDILHVIAMAIHPHPQEQAIRETVAELEGGHDEDYSSSSIWTQTKLLMSNLVPHSFHTQYRHRLTLVQIVTDWLVLPEWQNSDDAPLFEGAIPHLRASLYAFGLAAMSPYDAHWAQCGLVSISVQTGKLNTVKEEWRRLLDRLVNDRTECKCSSHHGKETNTRKWRKFNHSFMITEQHDDDCFCPHRARGYLLETCLTRYCKSRQYADEEFLQYALSSLTEAIEWLVDCWTKSTSDNDGISTKKSGHAANDEKGGESQHVIQTTSDPPCVLSSLLFTAKSLFYFLLPMKNIDDQRGEESEESRRRDMLISCCIQLIHHWDKDIAKEASELLILAFSYGPEDMATDYAGALFESTKIALEETFTNEITSVIPVEGIVAVFARKSKQYAHSILSFLLCTERIPEWGDQVVAVHRIVAAIVTACPAAGIFHLDTLLAQLKSNDNVKEAKEHLVASILACRKAILFQKNNSESDTAIQSFMSSRPKESYGWRSYLLGRFALVTGNFGIAKTTFQHLSTATSSECSFIWLSVLGNVADAENILSCKASYGIPVATQQIRSAASFLQSLSSLNEQSPDTSFAFQTRFLNLRLEFLDLLVTIRHLVCEMRLTGTSPKKNTRPYVHLQTSVKHFSVLADKYMTMYRQFGLFIDQQSRTCLRTLFFLCRFVARSTRNTFVGTLLDTKTIQEVTFPKGDPSHPVSILIKKLDASVFKEMNSTIDEKIRAAAMLQVMDGLLRATCPFPRAFTLTKSIPLASMKLSADLEVDHIDDVFNEIDDDLEIFPGSYVTLNVSGGIPAALLRRAKLPFCTILLWHKVIRLASRNERESQSESIPGQEDKWSNINPGPTAVSMSSNGTFFIKLECQPIIDEGVYNIEIRLGCRDVRGGEWELPLNEPNPSVSVRVARSKN